MILIFIESIVYIVSYRSIGVIVSTLGTEYSVLQYSTP